MDIVKCKECGYSVSSKEDAEIMFGIVRVDWKTNQLSKQGSAIDPFDSYKKGGKFVILLVVKVLQNLTLHQSQCRGKQTTGNVGNGIAGKVGNRGIIAHISTKRIPAIKLAVVKGGINDKFEI